MRSAETFGDNAPSAGFPGTGERRLAIDAFGVAREATADYYEVLQVSRNAHPLIVAKAYRLLAALYHPDNTDTGNKDYFLKVVEAYRVLSDPVRRAAYDRQMFGTVRVDCDESRDGASRVAVSATRRVEDEGELRQALLQALYAMRRNQPQNPGLSLMALAELLGCSIEVMQFTLWYLRGKKLIDTVDDGNVAITVLGVDHIDATKTQPGRPETMLAMHAHRAAIEAASENGSSIEGAVGADGHLRWPTGNDDA